MTDFNMGNQFKGLPMGDLIGGPLMAAADAQVRLANSTAQFIQQIGFRPGAKAKPDADGNLVYDSSTFDVRTVDFKFERPAGPADAKTGIVPTETVSLEVPLLAIVKVPALGIETVDIIFDMEVKNTESSTDSTSKSGSFSADASVGWGPFSLKVHVEGSVASHQENTRSTDQTAKYHVEVHAADRGMPEGLARVLDMMNQSVAPKTVVPTAPAKQPAPMQPGTTTDTMRRGLDAPAASDVILDHDESGARVLTPGRYEVVGD